MNIIQTVLEKLKIEGINAVYNEKDYRITWLDPANDEHHIFELDIDYSNGKIAWFQSSYWDKHLLRVFEGNESFSWEPITYNPVFGCDCHLIEWYEGYLIFVYQEKHDVYICILRDKTVSHFNFHGDQILRNKDLFYFKKFRSDKISCIKIPELIELAQISRELADIQGFLPLTIGYPNNLKGV